MNRQVTIGQTVLGRDIDALHFAAPDDQARKPAVILFGAIHGDEPLGVHCLVELARELAASPPGRDTWLIPALNVDGLEAGTKNNANDVDLNRNFAAANWVADHKAGYNPGAKPLSEPESRALAELIDRLGATRFVALHSPFHMVNYDGSGRVLAELMSAQNDYPVTGAMGYPTPGSFGSLYGVDRGLEVVTLEIPPMEDDEAWRQNRGALRLCVDLGPT